MADTDAHRTERAAATGSLKLVKRGQYQARAAQAGEVPRWNFHKYLLDRNGRGVARFSSTVRPDNVELVQAIESLL